MDMKRFVHLLIFEPVSRMGTLLTSAPPLHSHRPYISRLPYIVSLTLSQPPLSSLLTRFPPSFFLLNLFIYLPFYKTDRTLSSPKKSLHSRTQTLGESDRAKGVEMVPLVERLLSTQFTNLLKNGFIPRDNIINKLILICCIMLKTL